MHLIKYFAAVTFMLSAASAFAEDGFELLGTIELPGNGSDASGLTDQLEEGKRHNLLGGFSAMEYVGNDEYLILPDRGPGDGANSYRCRFHKLQIAIDLEAKTKVSAKLTDTIFLTTADGEPLIGHAKAFARDGEGETRRFDPEGIRLLGKQSLVISDEYGPEVTVFSMAGVKQRDFSVPDSYKATYASVDPLEEAAKNNKGRQPNGGFEGLAITPSGKKIIALIQRPLIQDSVDTGDDDKRDGIHCRMVEFDSTGQPGKEYVYTLDKSGLGQSEMLAISETEFLVLERDSKPGMEAKSKRLYLIDTRNATDVSKIASLPAGALDSSTGDTTIRSVDKRLFLDLLAPESGIERASIGKKQECLTFGPTLADGRRTLIIGTDNDFMEDVPSVFYVYAIDPKLLPNFGWNW